MIVRCTVCGREYLEIDARRVAEPVPRCVTCIVDGYTLECEVNGKMRAVADALRCIAPVPVSWHRGRTARRVR